MVRGIAIAVMFAGLVTAARHAAAETATAEPPRRPSRIVSLNLCADELVLRLADRADIAAVSYLSRDADSSNVVALATQVPVNHGLAEEIIGLAPDLVVASVYSARTTVAMLRRAHLPLIELGGARSLDEVRQQVRRVAQAVGWPERGEQVIAAMDRRLAAVARSARPVRALVLNPNGFTSGSGSLLDEILAAAGLINVAAELGAGAYEEIPLERVVTSRPDLLILDARRDGPASWATALLSHPVLGKLAGHPPAITLPSRLWACGGPEVVDAVERLAGATVAKPSGRQ